MMNRKVAIIDHDEKFLEDIEEILSISGYNPFIIKDPLLAVNAAVQNKPDVILLELKMPNKNGFEIADSINRALGTKKIPIIAMSDFLKDEFGWLLNSCGIKKLLKKPFHPLDLIWAIEHSISENS